ncbi:glutathione synthetase-like [Synchiropus splendidus]|uniref:glutathione synthetase-like n=1 Tax=Synchiropus splendidus TaxID=270530 RepID=UPI00237E7552|nr:glutathione synthetase-like [Synchiropus splendidus]
MEAGTAAEVLDNPQLVQDLAADAKDLALLKGLLMRTYEAPNASELVTYVPFTLFPTPLPKALYHQAVAVQPLFNTLVDKISQDSDFLQEALASTIAVDEFTARLFRIHQQVLEEGRAQSIVLGSNRSDYMVDRKADGSTSLKQIEMNTIAAGFGGPASAIPEIHRHVLRVAGRIQDSQRVMDNNPAKGQAEGIIKAWELYGAEKAVVLFVVEEKQRNIFDQRLVENEIWARNINVMRRRFNDVSKSGFLDHNKRLLVEDKEVAVLYFRNGYNPENYTSEKDWEARLMMERSRAVKCPDISTQLVGTKKVQQVLAKPGVLERFLPEQPKAVEQIRATFAGLYTLDPGPEGDRTVRMALESPDRFVLKPQREGGGNNIYGSEICATLQNGEERMAYILMDKLHPAPTNNCLLRRDAPVKMSSCISELGVFGVYVRHNTDMVMNQFVGHLLRSKSSEQPDGGVVAGIAVLDNPLLF